MTPMISQKAKEYFPAFYWLAKTVSGRSARRIYLGVVVSLLLLSTVVRIRAYFMTRKIEAVLHGLSEVRLNQTTEEEMAKAVPYLSEREWKGYRVYFVSVSNERSFLFWSRILMNSCEFAPWLRRFMDLLGYRYIGFNAQLLVRDGKVSHVEYGLANQLIRPQVAGYVDYVVSARSVHGFWARNGVWTTSTDDYSPQYRPRREKGALNVFYTSEALPETTDHIFHLNLSCFWSLGCVDAAEIAPQISDDVDTIRKATYKQLMSGKCPDSIIEGRMRYLPDVPVLLLEVTGSRRLQVNEEGDATEDWFTDYSLKEVIRGRAFGSWKNVRFRRTIPSPMDPAQEMGNSVSPETKIGSQVLYFGSDFRSCRFIPATSSALAIVRNTSAPPKSPEDQILRGIL